MSTRIQILKDGVITVVKSTNDKQLALNSLVSTMTANRVLRSNGTNIVLSQIDLTTDVTGVLPPANGGAGSSASYVDLTTNQTISGIKHFNGELQLPNNSGATAGTIWRSGDALNYKDGANVTKVLLNSAGNLSNLMDKQVSLNNLVGTQTNNRVLRSNGTNVTLSQVALDTDVTNTLPISSGGTGSNTQNFVDLTTNQSIGGNKYFTKSICLGLDSAISITQFNNSHIQTLNSIGGLNLYSGSFTGTANLASSFAFNNVDVEINSANTSSFNAQCLGQQLRIRNFGTGLINTLQGGRFTSLNSNTGSVTSQDGGYFLSRNDSTGTITTLNGGQFVTSVVAGTVTSANAGLFTVSTAAGSSTTTIRGILINASSSNTTPANDCIGLDITSITGTANNKFAIRTGTGRVVIGDNTASTSTTTGAFVVAGSGAFGAGIYAAGTINFALPTSSNGLATGSLWRNGNVVNIV